MSYTMVIHLLQKILVTNDILSNYCKSIADKFEIKVGDVKKINS